MVKFATIVTQKCDYRTLDYVLKPNKKRCVLFVLCSTKNKHGFEVIWSHGMEAFKGKKVKITFKQSVIKHKFGKNTNYVLFVQCSNAAAEWNRQWKVQESKLLEIKKEGGLHS